MAEGESKRKIVETQVNVAAVLVLAVASGLVALFLVHRRKRERPPRRPLGQPVHRQMPTSYAGAGPAEGLDPWGHMDALHSRSGGDLVLDQAIPAPPLPLQLMDVTLPVSVRELWQTALADTSFHLAWLAHRRNREPQIGPWLLQGSRATRNVSYISPVKKNIIGPGEALCLEEWVCEMRSTAGFTLSCRVFNPKVPYGGSFHTELQWIAEACTPQTTRLRINADVSFTSRIVVPGVKTAIKGATIHGLRETYAEYATYLGSRVLRKGMPMPSHVGRPAPTPPRPSRMPAAIRALLLLLLLVAGVLVTFPSFPLPEMAGLRALTDNLVNSAVGIKADTATVIYSLVEKARSSPPAPEHVPEVVVVTPPPISSFDEQKEKKTKKINPIQPDVIEMLHQLEDVAEPEAELPEPLPLHHSLPASLDLL